MWTSMDKFLFIRTSGMSKIINPNEKKNSQFFAPAHILIDRKGYHEGILNLGLNKSDMFLLESCSYLMCFS